MRLKFLDFDIEHSDVLRADAVINAPLFLLALLTLTVFAVWAVTLMAVLHSQRHSTAAKTLWALTVSALPLLGSVLWLLHVKNPRPPTSTS